MLVAPEQAAAEQEQQREDREFGAADALLAAVAVVPGEDQDDGQADQQCEAGELAASGAATRAVELTYSRPCRKPQAPAA